MTPALRRKSLRCALPHSNTRLDKVELGRMEFPAPVDQWREDARLKLREEQGGEGPRTCGRLSKG